MANYKRCWRAAAVQGQRLRRHVGIDSPLVHQYQPAVAADLPEALDRIVDVGQRRAAYGLRYQRPRRAAAAIRQSHRAAAGQAHRLGWGTGGLAARD